MRIGKVITGPILVYMIPNLNSMCKKKISISMFNLFSGREMPFAGKENAYKHSTELF